jgi:hypothetical protein
MGERPRGPLPGWQPQPGFQAALLADIMDRLSQHDREGTLPRSPRGLFYDLRPSGYGRGITYTKYPAMHRVGTQQRKVNPMDASVSHVQEVLALARRAGLVRESWIEDTRAPLPAVPSYDTETAEQVAGQLADMVRNPALEYSPQEDQETYLEVLVEAAGLISRLERIAAPYGVPVYSGGGYGGIKGKRAAGGRAARREVPTVVLQVTDYDDHGLRIARASTEDSTAWAEQYYDAEPGWLTFERIALTEDQAASADLLDQFGKAEADGLPVPVMDQILRDAIEGYQDPALREQTIARAAGERERVPDLVRELLAQD